MASLRHARSHPVACGGLIVAIATIVTIVASPLLGVVGDGRATDMGDEPSADPSPPRQPVERMGRVDECAAKGKPLFEALKLERRAHLAWQRSRFEQAELPRALRILGRAQQCAQEASDRGLTARVDRTLASWTRQWEVRVDRASLRLYLGLRRADPKQIGRSVRTLEALTREAGVVADSYRLWLENLRRRVRAHRANTHDVEGEDS